MCKAVILITNQGVRVAKVVDRSSYKEVEKEDILSVHYVQFDGEKVKPGRTDKTRLTPFVEIFPGNATRENYKTACQWYADDIKAGLLSIDNNINPGKKAQKQDLFSELRAIKDDSNALNGFNDDAFYRSSYGSFIHRNIKDYVSSVLFHNIKR